MGLILVGSLAGLYAFSEEGEVVARYSWGRTEEEMAQALFEFLNGKLEGADPFIQSLVEKGETLFSPNPGLLRALTEKPIQSIQNQGVLREISEKLPSLVVEEGIVSSPEEYGRLSHRVLTRLARLNLKKSLSKRESLIVPMVQTLDEVDSTLNALAGRLREWYGIFFPELNNIVRNHYIYARIVARFPSKAEYSLETLLELSLDAKVARRVVEAARDSAGAQMNAEDWTTLSGLADNLVQLHGFRSRLSEYLTSIVADVAPNTSKLAGPLVAAKLIAKAGSLKQLALMPSSTIQVLGAEKAMFRAIKTKSKPPKHGILYQHPYVNRAPRHRRGGRARALASKIAIAARADYFTGDYLAEELAGQLKGFHFPA